jgi:ssRNA-specific RNase YbeY (16S rRNA maturation enzyme)
VPHTRCPCGWNIAVLGPDYIGAQRDIPGTSPATRALSHVTPRPAIWRPVLDVVIYRLICSRQRIRCPASQNIPAPTDILSFGLLDAAPGCARLDAELGVEPEPSQVHHELSGRDLGDLMLGVEYLQRWTTDNATTFPLSVRVSGEEAEIVWQQRVPVIVAHGLAHLLGHTHEEDADHQQMQACEQDLLRLALTSAHLNTTSGIESGSTRQDKGNGRATNTERSMPLPSLETACRAGCADRAVEVGVCCAACVSALYRPPRQQSTQCNDTEATAAGATAQAPALPTLGLSTILSQGCEF